MNARITLKDGTTWESRTWANSLMPSITNVDDPEREMTVAQFTEYSRAFLARNSNAVRDARRKLEALQRQESYAVRNTKVIP